MYYRIRGTNLPPDTPNERGSGVEFLDKVVGGSIPRNLIPAVQKGVEESCHAGPLAGYPVVGVKAVIFDGKEHPVDSKEIAFQTAGDAIAFCLEAQGALHDADWSVRLIDDALAVLEERRMLYKKDGATWFPSIQYGDDKDRVVVRDNGVKTYFASDIAYHFDKRERGFDHLIDILGADHHGYVTRVKAGLDAMGYKAEDLEVELVQFVALYRGGRKVQMSTRSGEFDKPGASTWKLRIFLRPPPMNSSRCCARRVAERFA